MDVKKRVKVYQLDSDGKWEDKGTGYISFVTYNNIQYILVKSEIDSSTILESKIQADEPYQKQQDSLIVWTDPQTSIDLALSFQDPQGCQEIWDGIENYQFSHYDLPPVSLENLYRIQELLDPSILDHKEKEKVANSVSKDYIEQILDLFEDYEKSYERSNDKSNDRSIFFLFFHIFKNLILFNDTSIFENLLSEEYIIRVLGALEYDPEISEQNRIRHREFLNHHVIFKTVGLDSKPLIGMIHQTFRIQYLKDVVLPRILDDATFSSLNSIIYFNNIDIVTQIQSDSNFLQQLFSKIQKSSPLERTDYLLFLQELCNLAKGLQIQNKISFFSTLKSFDLFKTLSSALEDIDIIQNRISSTEIILSTLLHDPSILRKYITEDSENHKFLSQLVSLFINDKDIGVKNQIVEIIKILLDIDVINDTSDFFKLFYEKGIYELVKPLDIQHCNSGEPIIPGDPSSNLESFVLYNVMELVIYCVKHHLYRIKNFIIQEGITKKILKFTDTNEKYLVLGAIRFFRSLVSMKDDIYNKHIISENLFDSVVDILKTNISKNNLLNSAVIELFQFIYKENIKDLVVYLVDRYKDLFESIQYTDVPKLLIVKYEQIKDQQLNPTQNQNNTNNTNSQLTAATIHQDVSCNNSLKLNNLYQKAQKEFENDEDEAYFNDDDDDDDDIEVNNINTTTTTTIIQQTTNDDKTKAANVAYHLQQLNNRMGTPIPSKLVDYEDDDDMEINANTSSNKILTPTTTTTTTTTIENHHSPDENGKEINNNNNSSSEEQVLSPSKQDNNKKRKFEDEDNNDNNSNNNSSGNERSKSPHLYNGNNNNSSSKYEDNESNHENNNNNNNNNNNDIEENGTDHRTKRLKLIYNENDENNTSSNEKSSNVSTTTNSNQNNRELVADI